MRDLEDGAATGGEEPLMTVRNQKVRVQLPQVQGNLSNPMRGVDTAQDAEPSALLRQPLKRKPHSRRGTNGVKDSHFGLQALVREALDALEEPLYDLFMLTRKLIPGDLPRLSMRCRLQDGEDRILAGAVDGVEVDYHVSRSVDEIPEHRVDAHGGVLEEDAGVDGHVEEFGDGAAGREEVLFRLVAHELVRGGFGEVLEAAEFIAHGFRIGAVGAVIEIYELLLK